MHVTALISGWLQALQVPTVNWLKDIICTIDTNLNNTEHAMKYGIRIVSKSGYLKLQ